MRNETSPFLEDTGAGSTVADPRSVEEALDCFPLTATPEDVLRWPPDVFAVTARLLLDTEGYRFVVSPPRGEEWPPNSEWADFVSKVSSDWVEATNCPGSPLPTELEETWNVIWDAKGVGIDDLKGGARWDVTSALLSLHAMADQAAANLGRHRHSPPTCFEAIAWRLLGETGSLSHFPPWLMRVLPKTHLGAGGINLRSLSRYLAVHAGQIDISWTRLPIGDLDARDAQGSSYNILLLPWPLQVDPLDFCVCTGPLREMPSHFGFFTYAPRFGLDFSYVASAMRQALTTVEAIDAVLLPEAALAPEELPRLEAIAEEHGAYFVVSGVRRLPEDGALGANYAHVAMWYRGQWHRLQVNKHHRWNLDESQISQYGLGDHLDPSRVWWEAIGVPLRKMHIVDVGGGATTSIVICEDLARLDVVAEVLRYVGPTFVISLLMDGPQLATRWSARYAGVLADDPGSTVLTLTSLGMAEISRHPDHPPSRSIALWKDPERGLKEIEIPPGANAMLLQIGEQRKTVWTADGRQHDGRTPRLVLDAATPIYADTSVPAAALVKR